MREIVATLAVMQGIMMATAVWIEVRQYFERAKFFRFVTLLSSRSSSQIPQNTLQDEQASSNPMKGMVCSYTERLKDNVIYKLMDFLSIHVRSACKRGGCQA